MKALVTGGAGFVGSHVVDKLLAKGIDVRIYDLVQPYEAKGVEYYHASLLDMEKLRMAMKGVDVVFHLAAVADVKDVFEEPHSSENINVRGTINILEAARRMGVKRVVYGSTVWVYSDTKSDTGIVDEDTPLTAPSHLYTATKLAGEYYLRAFHATYGLETVTIRYFNVFGPRQDPNSQYSAVIPLFVTAMLRGQRPTVFGDGTQSRDFTYVDNVVAGNLAAADAPKAVGKSINVACGRQTDLLELIASVNRVLGTEIEPVFDSPRPGDVRESLADITLAREALGYEPLVSFDEGLRRSIEYYRSLM